MCNTVKLRTFFYFIILLTAKIDSFNYSGVTNVTNVI